MKRTTASITRRRALTFAAVSLSLAQLGCSQQPSTSPSSDDASTSRNSSNLSNQTDQKKSMHVHYLEIVTTDVESACKLYSKIHAVSFSEPISALGGARTASLAGGGMIGVRAPMHSGERPVTRAYVLVDDINAAIAAAAEAGAVIAVPPMKLEGYGQCAIYILGGVEAGLWQM